MVIIGQSIAHHVSYQIYRFLTGEVVRLVDGLGQLGNVVTWFMNDKSEQDQNEEWKTIKSMWIILNKPA